MPEVKSSGQTTRLNIETRLRIYMGNSSNIFLHFAINSFGFEDFDSDVTKGTSSICYNIAKLTS